MGDFTHLPEPDPDVLAALVALVVHSDIATRDCADILAAAAEVDAAVFHRSSDRFTA